MEKTDTERKIKELLINQDNFDEIIRLVRELNSPTSLADKYLELFSKFKESGFTLMVRRLSKLSETHFTPSIEELTGYSIQEINELPSKFVSLVFDEDVVNIRNSFKNIELNNINYTESSYRLKNKNGLIIWINEYLTKIYDETVNDFIVISILINASGIKKREVELDKSNYELHELNKAKDKLISIVSHDLRAPFTSLLGFTEILLNESNLSEKDRTEYLKYIYEASQSQLQLVNYLLDWSRLKLGTMTVNPVRLNLKMLISNCVSSLTGAAIRKNIDIKTDISSDINVNCDERLTTQAISNLISNAIKFTPESKRVYVSAEKFKEGMIEIIIKDEGVGIAEKNQEKLFRIDQKFSLSGTSGEKGSGLGLTLVKEIVENQNGDIWFYSKENEGSEFHITLPESQNIILIVEDDPIQRNLYKRIVSKALVHFQVLEAVNGFEAMSILMKNMPSLIITDHDMPLMNGIQLVEALRKKDPHKKVEVIVISAKLDNSIDEKYLELGVKQIHSKPIHTEKMVKVLQQSIY